MTEREGDLEDCESLVMPGIDWRVILSEIKAQIRLSKQDVWITWIGERLDTLQDRGMEIPIMKDLNTLRNKFFNDLQSK